MKLTNRDINTMHAALLALDSGFQHVVKDGETERLEHRPFAFRPEVHFAFAVNLTRLSDALRPVNKATADLFRKYAVDGRIDPAADGGKHQAYQFELDDLYSAEQDVELKRVSEADLELGRNRITIATLSTLMRLFEDEPSGGARKKAA